MNFLSCDLGGSTASWGVFNASEGDFTLRTELSTAAYEDFYEMLDDFLIKYRRHLGDSEDRIVHATFAIAGPTDHKIVRPTNIESWEINVETTDAILQDHGHAPHSTLVNDFEALGYGLLHLMEQGLSQEDFTPVYGKLRTGPARTGQRLGIRSLICGPGTGLGMSCVIEGLVKDGYPYILSSESGHRSIAPETPEQYRLLSHDGIFKGKMSYEAALSRDGLRNLYNFFRREDYDAEPVYGISAEKIVDAAITGKDQAATDAIELFCEILANFCGNLALTFNCDRAVFLWGGVLSLFPLDLLQGRFKRGYAARVMHGELVSRVPVVLINNLDTPLLGCALRSRFELEARGGE